MHGTSLLFGDFNDVHKRDIIKSPAKLNFQNKLCYGYKVKDSDACIQHCIHTKDVSSLKAWTDFQKHTVSVDIFLQIKYQPNIYQQQWYDMKSEDCNFHRNQTFGRRIGHIFVYFGPQKLGILTARLNKSLSISTSIQ